MCLLVTYKNVSNVLPLWEDLERIVYKNCFEQFIKNCFLEFVINNFEGFNIHCLSLLFIKWYKISICKKLIFLCSRVSHRFQKLEIRTEAPRAINAEIFIVITCQRTSNVIPGEKW